MSGDEVDYLNHHKRHGIEKVSIKIIHQKKMRWTLTTCVMWYIHKTCRNICMTWGSCQLKCFEWEMLELTLDWGEGGVNISIKIQQWSKKKIHTNDIISSSPLIGIDCDWLEIRSDSLNLITKILTLNKRHSRNIITNRYLIKTRLVIILIQLDGQLLMTNSDLIRWEVDTDWVDTDWVDAD